VTQPTQAPESVRKLIDTVRERLGSRAQAARMFETCITNTLHTTIKRLEDGTTFVITGDIPAMWLRDSAAQVRPYLALAREDEDIAAMIGGLVERQSAFILHDPYANAFNESANGQGHQNDRTDMSPHVWERKYEIDSLCYPIQLAYLLWKTSGSDAHLHGAFREAVPAVLKLWRTEQRHEEASPYRFERTDCPPSDTLTRDGKGSLTGYTGMTWSGFRPSDDACRYGYLVPSNMFAVVALRYAADIARTVWHDEPLAAEAESLGREIDEGIRRFAVVDHPAFGPMYAYETDGLGNHHLMDDANVPSLLSIPYLGYASAEDELYRNTRRFVLSESNPYFYRGAAAEGIGSPHTPDRYIWHIALAMQGLTAETEAEKLELLDTLVRTDGGKGMMHEGFDADDPTRFTREWFSWANMMFCELALDACGIRVGR